MSSRLREVEGMAELKELRLKVMELETGTQVGGWAGAGAGEEAGVGAGKGAGVEAIASTPGDEQPAKAAERGCFQAGGGTGAEPEEGGRSPGLASCTN